MQCRCKPVLSRCGASRRWMHCQWKTVVVLWCNQRFGEKPMVMAMDLQWEAEALLVCRGLERLLILSWISHPKQKVHQSGVMHAHVWGWCYGDAHLRGWCCYATPRRRKSKKERRICCLCCVFGGFFCAHYCRLQKGSVKHSWPTCHHVSFYEWGSVTKDRHSLLIDGRYVALIACKVALLK